ncbi:hypothetical protein [Roseivirga pacifica]|jgi:heme exporter protein D|uniref:hypothetical protein n=1 Tax=Roseivirga pacifica TaxID=1267423 RepID=UPI002095A68E|nr:hypothetical protein [Roseivirga pacifica]
MGLFGIIAWLVVVILVGGVIATIKNAANQNIKGLQSIDERLKRIEEEIKKR